MLYPLRGRSWSSEYLFDLRWLCCLTMWRSLGDQFARWTSMCHDLSACHVIALWILKDRSLHRRRLQVNCSSRSQSLWRRAILDPALLWDGLRRPTRGVSPACLRLAHWSIWTTFTHRHFRAASLPTHRPSTKSSPRASTLNRDWKQRMRTQNEVFWKPDVLRLFVRYDDNVDYARTNLERPDINLGIINDRPRWNHVLVLYKIQMRCSFDVCDRGTI